MSLGDRAAALMGVNSVWPSSSRTTDPLSGDALDFAAPFNAYADLSASPVSVMDGGVGVGNITGRHSDVRNQKPLSDRLLEITPEEES